MYIKQYLKKNWAAIFKEEVPDNFDCVVLSSCLEDYGNNLVLIFPDRFCYPKYIMKMSRTKRYGFKIEREYQGLLSVSKNPDLKKYIPFPHKSGTLNGLPFVIQGGIPGESLHEILRQKGYISHTKKLIDQAIDLLVEINTTNVISEVDKNIETYNVVDALKNQPELICNAGLSCSELEPFVEQYNTVVDRVFFVHGDFWGANILIDPISNKVSGIIDWEFSNSNSRTLPDIMWFVLNLLFAFNFKKIRDGSFSNIIISSLSIPASIDLIRDCFKRYSSKMGIKDLNCGQLLICTLFEMSFREMSAYGSSNKMDSECLSLLKFLTANKQIMDAINGH
ncbi:MAG: phosphotransferase [Desulfobacterium sp.]|jgi:hypothetical protein|nr:phosphotransferase [Desulfobacterium sp.]